MEMQERINRYWSLRADEFADARYRDIHSQKKQEWMSIIRSHLPEKDTIRALDMGTGAGFFAFLLNELGCEVTGIDYSQAMIDGAQKNMASLGYHGIQFRQMDAQQLDFENESFDFIFTRNVTWTLPNPEKAYAEMCRVLSPCGRLLNFDANYGAAFQKLDAEGATEQQAENGPSRYENPARSLDMLRERNDIAKNLHICDKNRPLWDVEVLLGLGIQRITVNTAAQRFFNEAPPAGELEKIWSDTPALFMVLGEKI